MKTDTSNNVNDLVYKIASRVKELSDESMDMLRLHCNQDCNGSNPVFTLRKTMRGRSRGDLIEEILLEEFIEEFPRTIQAE